VDGSGGEQQLMGSGPEVELIAGGAAGEALVDVPLRIHGEARGWERDGSRPRFQEREGSQWGRGMRRECRASVLGAGLQAAELAWGRVVVRMG